MANRTEQMQGLYKEYVAAGHSEWSSQEAAAWAVMRGLYKPKTADLIARCAEELAKAAREEYRTDADGRRYRARHSVKTERDGEQVNLWVDIDTAPRDRMERAFSQRRQQIVGDCLHLKTDVDHYNAGHVAEVPIQLILDFTEDVAEIQTWKSAA